MAISTGTGEIFSFLEIASPTGATISTVATLSTNALTTPANSASTVTAHLTLGTFTISTSARYAGIRLSMNSVTMPHRAGDHQQDVVVHRAQRIRQGEVVHAEQPQRNEHRRARQ